jgi:hypothetical protein
MNAMLSSDVTSPQIPESIPVFGAAICSNCLEIVAPAPGAGGPQCGSLAYRGGTAPDAHDVLDTVLLESPCPRCGEEALSLTDSVIWE